MPQFVSDEGPGSAKGLRLALSIRPKVGGQEAQRRDVVLHRAYAGLPMRSPRSEQVVFSVFCFGCGFRDRDF